MNRIGPIFEQSGIAGRKLVLAAANLTFVAALISVNLLPSALGQTNAITVSSISDAVMGFETTGGWIATGNDAATGTALSNVRTQGNFAYQLLHVANVTTLTSLPVVSTAHALAGVGNTGAVFEVDILLPAQQWYPVNRGSLKFFITSPSTGITNQLVGQVDFIGFRPGIYNTMKFPIPDSIRTALGGAAFNDLTFQFVLSALGIGPGAYLFDNLRIHSAPLVTASAQTHPPAGYGGSVDFVVIGDAPVAQTFDIGVVQVPDQFHLKLGTAGATTVELALGYDGTAAFACTYFPDTSDPAGTSYRFTSCTGISQPGDLLPANWARLTIVGGTNSMKLRAQLAENPVGDQTGSGIIPAMPTFWGDFDSCVPALVPRKVITTSPSCANQTAQANQIVTAYFNKVNNSNTAPNWIVTPQPEFSRRYGDGAPHNNLLGPPPPLGDPPVPFDQEGHLNPGGSFDGYWRLSGTFDAENKNTPNTIQSTAHLDATLGGHVVLFGNDIDVASISAVIDTSSGQGMFSTCAFGGPKTSPDDVACFDITLFGNDIPAPGNPYEGRITLPNGPLLTETANLDGPTIPIWIFSITPGATASVGIDLNNATFALSGFDVELSPSAHLGAHLFGGIDLGIASGGLDAKIELLGVSAPIAAQAEWDVSTLPTTCSATLNFMASGFVSITSGGGQVDLVASVGPCPFCLDESWKLFSWPALVAPPPYQLFNFAPTITKSPLPTALCVVLPVITILSPQANSTLDTGVTYPLRGSATIPGVGDVDCGHLMFSLSPGPGPNDQFNPSACGDGFMKLNSPGPRMLILTVNKIFQSFSGPILEQGAQPEPINVSPLPPGPHITQVILPHGDDFNTFHGLPQPPFDDKTIAGNNPVAIEVTDYPAPIQLGATIVGPSGTQTWSVTDFNGNSTAIGSGPVVTWTVTGDFRPPVTITLSDTVAGSATVLATVSKLTR